MFSSSTTMDCPVCHLGPMHLVLEMTMLFNERAKQIGNEMSEHSQRKDPSFKKVTGLCPAQALI